MSQSLTMEELLKAAAALKPGPSRYEVVAHPALEGRQAVIICGGKAYYSPDMAAGDVQVIEIPEFKTEPPMFLDIDYKPRANVCPTFLT